MSGQATVNGKRAREKSPTGRMTSDARHVAGDVADLCELQGWLFVVDLKDSVRLLTVPVVLAIVGAVVLATSSLLAFCAMALWLHMAHGFNVAGAFLLAAGGAVAFAGLCLLFSWLIVRWRGVPLARSWRELKRNLAWIRRALVTRR